MSAKRLPRRYWLLKSDPESFSFEDLLAAPRRRTAWDGVRNYQARNYLRDEVAVGDGVLFYHSGGDPPGVAGIARIVLGARVDPTQFDPSDEHFDAKSDPRSPAWVQVGVEAVRKLPRYVTLRTLRAAPALSAMHLLRPGQRLSVLPVTPEEWLGVLDLGGLESGLF